ncbi:MAG: hypothetical protein V3T44_08100, partial [bacterium]
SQIGKHNEHDETQGSIMEFQKTGCGLGGFALIKDESHWCSSPGQLIPLFNHSSTYSFQGCSVKEKAIKKRNPIGCILGFPVTKISSTAHKRFVILASIGL